MKVIKPTTYSPAMLVSTNAVETYSAYSSGTTYAALSRVYYASKVYESIAGGNLNHQPDTSPTFWTLVGPDNRSAMFDSQVSTATTKATTLTVVLNTGIIDSVALIGISADTARIEVRDGPGGTVVYDITQGLDGNIITDWYAYFFTDPLIRLTQVLFQGIPPYASSYVTLTLAGTPVSIGQMAFGTTKDIGRTQYNPGAGIIDYSRKETDAFGATTFVERAFSKRMTAKVEVDNIQLNRVQRQLYDLRATPCVWIGSDAPELSEALVVYGFYKDFSTDVAYFTLSLCSLEIEGLI